MLRPRSFRALSEFSTKALATVLQSGANSKLLLIPKSAC
jgi:hypothetical protein